MISFITSAIASANWLQLSGMIILFIGVIGTLFSSYRYLLAYMMAGMVYWMSIELISYLLQQIGFGNINAYVSAVGMSMVVVFIWIAATEPKRQRKRAQRQRESYIEHTPLYDGDVPTSKG